jgi:hypothetical protein
MLKAAFVKFEGDRNLLQRNLSVTHLHISSSYKIDYKPLFQPNRTSIDKPQTLQTKTFKDRNYPENAATLFNDITGRKES